jgi:alpha-L-fucosidase
LKVTLHRLALPLLALAAVTVAASGRTPPADEQDLRPRASAEPAAGRTKTLAAWESLRYGMFIHFGMATFTEDEFGFKSSPASAYNPTKLDVDGWIRVARDAGMKYAVLTTKHCTGHCLWPSAYTDYDVESSPVKTDVVGAFVKACRRYGLKPGFYYLLGWEGRHQARMEPAEYEEFCKNQLTELLTKYGPILEIWLDIPWDMGQDTAGALRRIYAHVKSLQPECLVMLNQGFQNGQAVAAYPPTYRRANIPGAQPVALWPRDLMDGERTLPPPAGHDPHIPFQGRQYYLPMEVCDTLAQNWFWAKDDAPRSLRQLYRLYKACRDRNADLLLDVGPDMTGRIPEAAVKRLMELKEAIKNPARLPVSLCAGRPAIASNVYHNDPALAPGMAVDDDSTTRWATDEEVHEAWLEVDLGAETAFDSAYLREGWNRTEAFQIEVPDGAGGWRAVFRGARIGGQGLTVRFAPVTAKAVRLHILKASVGPTLWDFEIYRPGR